MQIKFKLLTEDAKLPKYETIFTLENYIKWSNGDVELATKKLAAFRELQHNNSTTEFLQEKWGDDYETKSKERSTTSLEYYLKQGMTEAEALIARSNRQKTFSKEFWNTYLADIYEGGEDITNDVVKIEII